MTKYNLCIESKSASTLKQILVLSEVLMKVDEPPTPDYGDLYIAFQHLLEMISDYCKAGESELLKHEVFELEQLARRFAQKCESIRAQ